MPLSDLVAPEAILPALKVNSKKMALQELSDRAARVSGIAARDIFATIAQRERLGSTGIGNGIAIPHGKIAACDRIFGVFARLERPIDFDSLDDGVVDLICLLVAPVGAGADHLKALARTARLLRDPLTVAKLRATRDSAGLYAVLAQAPTSHAA